MQPTDQDEQYMRQALEAAEAAFSEGEVPVGSVLVCADAPVFTAYNLKERRHDPTAHAEIRVLREAAEALGRWRLGGTLYVTLEPCAMCAGALIQARIHRLVYGAADPKAGACGSVMEVAREPRFNHQVEVIGGVLAGESEQLLQRFFGRLRERAQPVKAADRK
ncbi:MAG: nucleoside deaminase [Candidatus Manganitrophaceae bacterium]|nr:MAG: nucleoside deaminase [Candidatus Manganitrophaceae bacterium]